MMAVLSILLIVYALGPNIVVATTYGIPKHAIKKSQATCDDDRKHESKKLKCWSISMIPLLGPSIACHKYNIKIKGIHNGIVRSRR